MLKFWLEPTVVLADDNGRMKKQEMKRARELVEKNRSKIIAAWNAHFAR